VVTSTIFAGLLAKVGNGQALTIGEAERAFDIMTSGNATPSQVGAFLMGLKVRGETADELAGGARALRAKVQRVHAPDGAIDIVGTGGDHHGTYNISSCSAWWWPARACPSPSTATAPSPRARARRTCWRHWASTSTCRSRRSRRR
jgi:hypothetical protein